MPFGFCRSPTLGVLPDALVTDSFSFGYRLLLARCLAGSWPSFVHVPGYLAYQRRPHGYRALHPKTAGDSTGLTEKDALDISCSKYE
jgi:hypothetical protein